MGIELTGAVCVWAACEFCINASRLAHGLEESASWRRQFLADPGKARLALCASSNQAITLYQKREGQWLLSCDQPPLTVHIPRYWRIETRMKYGMLFLVELPITVTIVILT